MENTLNLLSSLSKSWSLDWADPSDFQILHDVVVALGAPTVEDALPKLKNLEKNGFELGLIGTLALLSDREIVGKALNKMNIRVEDYLAFGDELGISNRSDYPFVPVMIYSADKRYDKVLKRAFKWGLDVNASWEVDSFLHSFEKIPRRISLVSECIRALNEKLLRKILPLTDTVVSKEEEESRWIALGRMGLRKQSDYAHQAQSIANFFLPNGPYALKISAWEVQGDDSRSLGHHLATTHAALNGLVFENAKVAKIWDEPLQRSLPSPEIAYELLERQIKRSSKDFSQWWLERITPERASSLIVPAFLLFFKEHNENNAFSSSKVWEDLMHDLIRVSHQSPNPQWQDPDFHRQIIFTALGRSPNFKKLEKLGLLWPSQLDTQGQFEKVFNKIRDLVIDRENAETIKDPTEAGRLMAVCRERIDLFLTTNMNVSTSHLVRPRL